MSESRRYLISQASIPELEGVKAAPPSGITALQRLDLSTLTSWVFAGGGNRCWWQAGVVAQWLAAGVSLPSRLAGTSAGAGIAAACLDAGPHAALEACRQLFGRTTHVVERDALGRGRLTFAHQQVYPAWLRAFVHDRNFERLRHHGTRLSVAFARPVRALGLSATVAVGTLAYVVDKHLAGSVHPRLPKWLGLRARFADLQDCADAEEAVTLLRAAAAAPPFMTGVRWAGAPALDGGFADNAPLPPQSETEKFGTLVLLTRHYPKLPMLFSMNGRSYCQPSCKVPVSTWDCTARATVADAFKLGQADGLWLLRRIA